MLGGINNFILQSDLVAHMLAVRNLSHLPSTDRHSTSNLHPQSTGCQAGIPVTRVTTVRDKKPGFRINKTELLVRPSSLFLKAIDGSGPVGEVDLASRVLPEARDAGPRLEQKLGLPR